MKERERNEKVSVINLWCVLNNFDVFKAGISEEDLEELKCDIALLKKVKKNKISEEQYEKEMGIA